MVIRALMVDVDGVLIDAPAGGRWDARLLQDLGIDPVALGSLFLDPYREQILRGDGDLIAVLGGVLAEMSAGVTAESLVRYWFTQDSNVNTGLLDELDRVRATGIEVHLATNQEHHRARHLWTELGFREHFDSVHYAADLGVTKPDPSFFAEIERRTCCAAEDLLLIDDGPGNVRGAQAAGWAAALWTPSSDPIDIRQLIAEH